MAIAVAAAGTMAGGMAGGALKNAMGGNASGMKISGTSGVKVATISEKQGKSTKKTYVPQADISESLAWFQQAASQQESYYKQGLAQYENSMAQAKKEIDSGYNEAFKTLKPMSYNSTQAGNEMMRFMGLSPLSATYDVKDRAIELGATPAQAKLIAQAEALTDPGERAAAMKKVSAGFTDAQKASTLEADIKAARAAPINMSGFESTDPLHDNGPVTRDRILIQALGGNPAAVGLSGNARYNEIAKGITDEVHKDYADVDSKSMTEGALASYMKERQNIIDNHAAKVEGEISTLKQKDAARAELNQELLKLQSDYEANYTAKKDVGYTGAEVTAKLEATPGYQFVADQGAKAIERTGAAKGMLGSGNTLVGLTQFGQENAQNYFGMHMNTLANIAQLGSGATNQLSGLQMQQGRDQSQLSQAVGNARMTAYGAIGDSKAQSLYKQGDLSSQASMFNTGLIQNTLESAKDRAAQAQNQATSSGPGYQNANLAQQQFNYGVFQNQQGGQAFAANQKTNQYGMKV